VAEMDSRFEEFRNGVDNFDEDIFENGREQEV